MKRKGKIKNRNTSQPSRFCYTHDAVLATALPALNSPPWDPVQALPLHVLLKHKPQDSKIHSPTVLTPWLQFQRVGRRLRIKCKHILKMLMLIFGQECLFHPAVVRLRDQDQATGHISHSQVKQRKSGSNPHIPFVGISYRPWLEEPWETLSETKHSLSFTCLFFKISNLPMLQRAQTSS